MRFKVDENLPAEVAERLRAAGHDATTVGEERLSGRPDDDIAHVVHAEQRALITLDLDFADVRRHPPQDSPGFVVLRLARQDKPYVLDSVGRLVPLLTTETLAGHLWIVEESRVRIRP